MAKCAKCGKWHFRRALDERGFCKTCCGVNTPQEKFDYYEEDIEFNTKWVSLNYGRIATASIIKEMQPGDAVRLGFSNSAFREGECIKVFDANGRQIGWVPNMGESGTYLRFIDAVKNKWPIDARVKLTGKVNDPEKNIRWCVVSVTFNVPYIPNGSEVYMAFCSNRYHSTLECGTARKRKVPLEIAKEYKKIPCPKCIDENGCAIDITKKSKRNPPQ